jgi:predicted transcriptional regulator
MSLEQLLFRKHVKEILFLLDSVDKLYVTEISKSLDLGKSTTSRVLTDLYSSGLIGQEKDYISSHFPKTFYFITEKGKLAIEVYKMIEKAEKIAIKIDTNHGTVINELKTDSLVINNNFNDNSKKK